MHLDHRPAWRTAASILNIDLQVHFDDQIE